MDILTWMHILQKSLTYARVNFNKNIYQFQCKCLSRRNWHLVDSQTFVKALLEGSSKYFFGGSNVIFVPSLYYFWPKNVFLPLSRVFWHQKNLASFLVILVQVYFSSQGSQKSLYIGLPHHFGIIQSWSLKSENFRKKSENCLSQSLPKSNSGFGVKKRFLGALEKLCLSKNLSSMICPFVDSGYHRGPRQNVAYYTFGSIYLSNSWIQPPVGRW